MKPRSHETINKCPLCSQLSAPYPHPRFSLRTCSFCNLIFVAGYAKHTYTENEKSWGENDPRLTSATAQMKKHTFRRLFKILNTQSVISNQQLAISKSNSRQLLDIGTGTGILLEVAKEFGFTPLGLEPDRTLVSLTQKKGLQVLPSPLDKTSLPSGSYDIITAIDVLEHLGNPRLNMGIAGSLLKQNGLLVISTPDIDSLSHKILKSRWPHFKNEHLFYYSPLSLKKLLEPLGFKILTIQPFPKYLTLEYAAGYFTAFKNPFLSPVIKILYQLSPPALRRLPIKLPNGNLLVIAQKI